MDGRSVFLPVWMRMVSSMVCIRRRDVPCAPVNCRVLVPHVAVSFVLECASAWSFGVV